MLRGYETIEDTKKMHLLRTIGQIKCSLTRVG